MSAGADDNLTWAGIIRNSKFTRYEFNPFRFCHTGAVVVNLPTCLAVSVK